MIDQPIRVLIVDDSAVARRALAQLVGAQPDMEVVDSASTGRDAVRRATELQPDIVLMDVHMPDMDGIQATWLVSNRAPLGSVIMVTSEERIDFLQKAMTAGAQGYVLKPFGNGAQLLDTVREVYARARSRRVIAGPTEPAGPELAPRIGKRIVVFGTKGGGGKTTLAVGLALSLRRNTSTSVVLFDADFLFGDANIHLDLPTDRSILDLLPHMDALDSRLVEGVIARHESGLALMPRPPRPEQAEVITPDHVRAVIGVLSALYEYVVIDTQPSYDERMLAVLDLADAYVLVMVPDLGVVRNTRHFLDVARTLGYPEDRMCFVLNRSNSNTGLTLDDIAEVLGTRRILQLPSAGHAVSRAINEGRPLVLEQPHSAFTRAVDTIADHVRMLASAVESRAQ